MALSDYFISIYPSAALVVYPTAMVCQTVSIYLSASIVVERYRCMQKCKNQSIKNSFVMIIVILLLSISFNATRFFEVQLEYNTYYSDEEVVEVKASSLRENEYYVIFYVNVAYFLIVHFLPFVTGITFISKIILKIKSDKVASDKNSHFLIYMTCGIFLTSIVSNSLSIAVNILEYHGYIFSSITQISNLLITINCSIKSIIYFILRKSLREHMNL